MRFRRKKVGGLGLFLILAAAILFTLSQISFATEEIPLPTPELPLVATTCGQSPGALMVKVVCDKVKLPCEEEDLLTAEILSAKAKEGKPYKTLMITTGTSLKGMGAAGIDIGYEVSRIKGVIEEAKKQGILIIGGHIEGMKRRVDETDYTSIRTVLPQSDLLIIRSDGNEDGFFTKISEEHNIPMIEIKETLDIGDALKKLFKMEG
jgi:hypothetical protein